MTETKPTQPRRSLYRIGVAAGMALSGIGFSGVAASQDANWTINPGLEDRWSLYLGAFFPNVKTTASLNSPTLGIGTKVSFEDDLGLSDHKTMGAILGRVRLGENWRLEAEYFALDRTAARTISKTINWGDNTYAIGTTVTSQFDSSVFRLSGGYSFIKDSQAELGVAIGVHSTDFSTSLGTATLGTKNGDTLAPLPTIGVYGAYAFTPRWLLSGRVDLFSYKYGDYDGSLTNFTAGVDYRFTRNFGIGAGYRYVDYDLKLTKPNFTGDIKYRFNGPTLYLTGSF